jgi:hypothetical protein
MTVIHGAVEWYFIWAKNLSGLGAIAHMAEEICAGGMDWLVLD